MPAYVTFLAYVYSFCVIGFFAAWIWLLRERLQGQLPGIKRRWRIRLGHLRPTKKS